MKSGPVEPNGVYTFEAGPAPLFPPAYELLGGVMSARKPSAPACGGRRGRQRRPPGAPAAVGEAGQPRGAAEGRARNNAPTAPPPTARPPARRDPDAPPPPPGGGRGAAPEPRPRRRGGRRVV